MEKAQPIGKDDPPISMLEESGLFEKTANGYLYEGDMILSEEQAMAKLQRKMFSSGDNYWPRNEKNVLHINYVIGDGKCLFTIINQTNKMYCTSTML